MNKISIIMPLYNNERFVQSAIESICRQNYPKWELIVVDDSSTDGSLEIVKSLAKEDERIKVFQMAENRGVASARNFGLSKAKGRYVAFLDSDDIWGKKKLRTQLFFMQKKRIPLSHTAYAYMNEQGSVMPLGYEKVDHLLGLEQYMKTTQINVSTVMIDRAKIPNFSFPEDKQLCEDARLWMNLMHQGYCFSGLNKILTLTRVHGNSLSHNKFKMAQNTLKRYLREKELPVYKRLYYFFNYAYHGFEKRLRPSQLHTDLVYERFYHQEKSRI